MLLIIHLLVAGLSVALGAYTVIRPHSLSLKAAGGLTVVTLLTGGALVFRTHSQLGPACLSGFVYLSCMILLMAMARQRSTQPVSRTDNTKTDKL